MLNARPFTGFTLAALALVSSSVLAHTEFKSAITEGVTDDNAVTIGHGCEAANGSVNPVIAQSVVFPSAEDHSDVIEQGTLAGLIDTIQDRNIFLLQAEKTDVNGNVIGFSGRTGILGVDQQGRVPFSITSPNFVGSSCVKRLLVEVAVADICKTNNPKLQQGKVNLWIPAVGSTYETNAGPGVEGIGEPAVLIINRDLAANPLDVSCGAGVDQTITPTAAEINSKLGIPGYW